MDTVKATASDASAPPRRIAQRVVSNFTWSVAGEALGKGVFFTANMYLARVLGAKSFGVFTLALTTTFYFWLAVDLGTNMYGIREIAKDKENAGEIINQLFAMRLTAGFAVFVLYILTLYLLEIPAVTKLVFEGCGLYLLTYAFYSDWVLKGLEKFKYIAYGSFAVSFPFLIFTLYLVKGAEDLTMASFLWSLSFLPGSISLLYFLYNKLDIKVRPSFDFRAWLSHLRESVYFTISGSLLILYTYLPVVLLSVFLTSYEVGIFSAPFRIIIMLNAAGFLLPSSFFPVLAELYKKDREKFHLTHRKFKQLMLALGILAGIVGTILAEEVVSLLLGTKYLESVEVFRIVIWLVPLYFIRSVYGTALMATGFQKHHNIASIAGVFGVAAAGLVLIPRYGVIGASVSLVTAEVIIISAMLIFSGKY